MIVDAYSVCPCGSGKKMKFCCSADLIPEIDKIIRAMVGDQRKSALDQIDRLIAQKGPRAALLTCKIELHKLLHEGDAFRAAVLLFHEKYPDNPNSLVFLAELHAIDGDVASGVDLLQRAIEISDGITSEMRSLFGILGQMLFAEGHFAAARAHFVLFEGLASEQTRETDPDLLRRFQNSRQISPLFKKGLVLRPPRPNAEWRDDYLGVIELCRKAHWAQALERLVALAQRFADQFEIMHGIATICGWLGNDELSIAAWRRLPALPGIDHDDAIDAEAMAQLLEGFVDADAFEVIELSLEIDDLNNALERLKSQPRLRSVPVSEQEGDEGPPPRAVFLVADRVVADRAPPSGPQDTPNSIPILMTVISLFGKETDRPARVDFQLIRDANYSEQLAFLKEALGGVTNQVESPIGKIGFVGNLLRQHCFPVGELGAMSKDSIDHREFPWHQIRSQVLPHASSLLHGSTLAQASQDSALRLRAEAYLLNLSLFIDNLSWEISLNDLRREVGLEPLPVIPEEAVRGNDILLHDCARVPRFDLEQFSDSLLEQMLITASYQSMSATSVRCAKIILARPAMSDHSVAILAHQILSSRCDDDAEFKMHVFRAADGMAKKDHSPAQMLLEVLFESWQKQFRTSFSAILERLQRQHSREPGVKETLYQFLVEIGALQQNIAATPPAAQVADAAAGIGTAGVATGAAIWTPDSAASESATGKSKLWLPGMD